jgi:hypothetical protein
VQFGTANVERTSYDGIWAIERGDIDERQARLDVIVAEFRAAQQRRLVKQAIALWNRSDVAKRTAAARAQPPAEKLN